MQDRTEFFRPLRKYIAKNPFWIIFLDILIAALTIAILLYDYLANTADVYKILASILLVFLIFVYIAIKSNTLKNPENMSTVITKLVLLNEEGENIREWQIQGKPSLLIGKSTNKSEGDIDLVGAEFAAQISRLYAVLNNAQGSWYIENIGSRNGIGIKKINNDSKTGLVNEKPYRIEPGDIIYVADTRLLAK